MSGAARDLARAGMVVTGALLVSRLLGWVRVTVIAASLGIGRELDIYIAAFRTGELGYASALSVVLLLIVAVIAWANVRQTDRQWAER